VVQHLKPPTKDRGYLAGEGQSGNSTLPGSHKPRKATTKRADVARVKAQILSLVEQGHTVEDACRLSGKSAEIWKYYRKTDPDFKDAGDVIRARQTGKKASGELLDISFEEFSEVYLNSKRFRHQMQWIDLIEGKTPRDLHHAQVYKAGDPDTVIINTPPGHAKSTTITMDYVTYKIVTNPEFRVVIISKTSTMAKKFLAGIKRRLTNKAFLKMQVDFGPPEGYERAAEMWTTNMIYFGHTESDQKDPNVEVLGIGQQIYGARADLIILDDVQDLNNAHQYDAHLDYVMQDVMTRDAPLVIVGTRVAPVDLYSELLNPEHYDGEESDWTYLSQPAVLEFDEDPANWQTLWPHSDRPHATRPGEQTPEGLWPKWDGPRLLKLRRKLKPSTWSLVYMQESVAEDSTFTIEAINGCQSNRNRGEKPPGVDNLHIVAGLDPASVGFTAAVVLAVDKRNGKRYLLDVHNKQVRSEGLRRLIMDWTEKYGINEWLIERNAFQAFLTQDREINQHLAARGVRLREHTTGNNKRDPQWGVASLEGLFKGWQDGEALLDLPGMGQHEAYRALKEQLCNWYPDHPKTQKTDTVMALWFAELGARDVTRHLGSRKQEFLDNPFLSANDRANRTVINIDDYINEQRQAM
jgi:hypothetical protein